MKILLINILIMLVWCALTGSFTPGQLAIGYFLGFLVIAVTTWEKKGKKYLRKSYFCLSFFCYLLWELVISNLRVAYAVIRPLSYCTPAVVAIPLACNTPLEITLLVNLISLTPGTLALDISSDNKTIYVHGMFIHDAEKFRQEIKLKLEHPLLEILR